MSIFRSFNISMIPGKPPLIIHVSQYESDFVYTFNLVSGKSVLAIPDTAIAVIRGTKRDGNGYSVEAALDAENHKVVVMGDVQMTACAGRNVFELAIINDEKVICTANFFIDVERAPLDSDTIQSETVLHDLQAIINSAATATQAAEEASASAAEAAESARTLTIDPTLTQSGQAADAKETGDRIDALKEDSLHVLNSSLSLIDDCNYALELSETKTGKYTSGNVGEAISFSDNSDFITKKFKIPTGFSAVYPAITLNSFTRITDVNGVILATGATSVESIPSGARYLYIAMNQTTVPKILEDDLIWIKSANKYNYATESTLYSPEYKDHYRNIIKPLWYDNIVDDSVPFITEKEILNTQFTINNSARNFEFYSNDGNVEISVTFNNVVTSGVADARLMYYDGTWHNVADTIKALAEGVQTVSWNVDCASLIQYNNATNFAVTFHTAGKSTIYISKLTGKALSNMSTYELYDSKFTTMMQNILSAVEGGEHGGGTQFNLRAPNGDKYGLLITPSNTLGTFKYVPDSMLIMGNSLVFGFSHGGESFGMAATSGENDFSYHLIEAIKEYNSGLTVNKLYSSPFEHCETLADAQTFLSNNTAYWSSDLDLVVIEMGDNVNTSTKREVFVQSFPLLLNKIRTQCPKARVVCVGIWFNNSTVYNTMTTNAEKYGCEFVDIRSIRSPETEGELNATVYFKDGTTTTVTEGRKTHPGNLGMERIADAIIAKLDM